MEINESYMWRALQLAAMGESLTESNPMVGAVIVADERIIGEGYHHEFGGPHAEVNAVESVKMQDRHLLKEATLYVTLEPCSHFGKTPPCCRLITDFEIPKVVVGSSDPNPKVAGKGLEWLRRHGVEVATGILEKECDELNRRFMSLHKKGRPYIVLKWAQSADGFMAVFDEKGDPQPFRFSHALSQVEVHRLRSANMAIMVGSHTKKIDCPRLDVRYWGGKSPEIFIAENNLDLTLLMHELKERNITSLIVEGGRQLLDSFINKGLYDEIRIEISPCRLKKGLAVPARPKDLTLMSSVKSRNNIINVFRR